MKYFDLHCDTIEELKKRGEKFFKQHHSVYHTGSGTV